MIESIGSLGQLNPSSVTLTTLYTVPADTQAVISTLVFCNLAASPAQVRVAIRVAGAAISNKQYLYYGLLLAGNDTFTATLGITLNAGDIVSVYATTGNIAFNLFGVERT